MVWVEVRAPAPVARLVDRPGVGLSVIPSPRGGGMVRCDKHAVAGSIRWAITPSRLGDHDQYNPRHRGFSGDSRRCWGAQAVDVVVA